MATVLNNPPNEKTISQKVFDSIIPSDKVFIEEESTVVKLYLVFLKCFIGLTLGLFLILALAFAFLERLPEEKIDSLKGFFATQTNHE